MPDGCQMPGGNQMPDGDQMPDGAQMTPSSTFAGSPRIHLDLLAKSMIMLHVQLGPALAARSLAQFVHATFCVRSRTEVRIQELLSPSASLPDRYRSASNRV